MDERTELQAAVQAALAICATCSHTFNDHEGPCTVITEDIGSVCPCPEFWVYRHEVEDGLRVTGHDLEISGTWPVRLNRRIPAEFWDSLQAGGIVRVEIELEIEGKGFKPERSQGVVVGLREFRKGRIAGVRLDGEQL
jgi:hypothetical protein